MMTETTNANETVTVVEGVNEKKDDRNIIKKVIDKFTPNKQTEFTAERAWIETTYGNGSYRTIDKRIADKQANIRANITNKFGSREAITSVRFAQYHCIVDIEDDLADHIDEVFAPFKENGFKVINISEKIDEIVDEHVFLVSWKNAFNSNKEEKK